MSWLRIDDSFDTHPKILGLKTDVRRWTWLRVLIYTCRHESPAVPDGIRDVIPKATLAFLRDCSELGLLEGAPGGYVVHDWLIYNGESIEKRVDYYLSRNPDASANDVQKAVGGKREIVLEVVRTWRLTSSLSGSVEPANPVPDPVPRNQQSGSQSGSRARAPQPQELQKQNPPTPKEARPAARENGHTLAPLDFLAQLEHAEAE